MGTAFEVFANFLEALITAQFYIRYLGCKERYHKIFVFGVSFIMHFAVVSVVNHLAFFNMYGDYALYILWFLLTVCLYRGKALEKLFLVGLRTVFVVTIILILYSFLGGWIEYDAEGYMVFGVARIAMVLLVKFLECAFYELLIRIRYKEKVSIDNRLLVGLNAMVWATCIAEKFLTSIYYDSSYDNQMHNEAMIITAAMLVANIVIYVMCISLFNSNAKLAQEKMKNLAYESRLKDVNSAIDLHRQTMKIRHDMKNELLKIKMKLVESKVEEAEKYLEETLDVKFAETHIVFTENMLVDAVINRCMEECRSKEIAVDAMVEGLIGNIEEMDVAILLSNLLDNAIEASEKAKEKRIEFRMSNKKGYLCIFIKNFYDGEVAESLSGLATTKQDKMFHGYGLLNVKDIVDKYNGNYNNVIGDRDFTVYVNLYMS